MTEMLCIVGTVHMADQPYLSLWMCDNQDVWEGIDNNNVVLGFNEVWKGAGTATMCGLDWH